MKVSQYDGLYPEGGEQSATEQADKSKEEDNKLFKDYKRKRSSFLCCSKTKVLTYEEICMNLFRLVKCDSEEAK